MFKKSHEYMEVCRICETHNILNKALNFLSFTDNVFSFEYRTKDLTLEFCFHVLKSKGISSNMTIKELLNLDFMEFEFQTYYKEKLIGLSYWNSAFSFINHN